MLSAIRPFELLSNSWSADDKSAISTSLPSRLTLCPKEIHSPHVLKMIRRFNQVSLWVATSILQAPDNSTRVATLSHFINVAQVGHLFFGFFFFSLFCFFCG
jgi:hypothetical protein